MLAERGSSLQPKSAMLAESGSGPSRKAEEMTYKAACAPVVSTAGSQRLALLRGLNTRVL